MENKSIYLDYAATTPVDERVAQAMLPYLTEQFGNPSSLHSYGRKARQAVARARQQVADLIGAEPEEIFFTSGGSESDNWVLRGIAHTQRDAGLGNHIFVSSIEHHAVLETCKGLEKEGFSVTYLPVDAQGRVSTEAVEAALREDTVLLSIMLANNEVGTTEPLGRISLLCQANNVFCHTDAVQAAGHIPIDVHTLSVDALSISGHKFYGPKGIGALYLRNGWHIEPLIRGGAQERGLRAGTENVPGIVGLGAAAAIALEEMARERKRLTELREKLMADILTIDGAWINGHRSKRLPGNISFGIRGIDHETLLIRLDLLGFAVSAGSACSAGSVEPSHVLMAMGQTREQADSAIRVTLGRYTTEADIQAFFTALGDAVASMRA